MVFALGLKFVHPGVASMTVRLTDALFVVLAAKLAFCGQMSAMAPVPSGRFQSI